MPLANRISSQVFGKKYRIEIEREEEFFDDKFIEHMAEIDRSYGQRILTVL